MANKAAAKASAAWAARAKKDGFPIRRETRCHCGHMISLKAVGRHNCSSRRSNGNGRLPAVREFKDLSLSQAVEKAMRHTSERTFVDAAYIDRSISRPAKLPAGWYGIL